MLNQADKQAIVNGTCIDLGLLFSLKSSIKNASVRQVMSRPASHETHGRLNMWARRFLTETLHLGPQAVEALMSAFIAEKMQDLGLGVHLFFNSQIFLIFVALIVWTVPYMLSGILKFQKLETDTGIGNAASFFEKLATQDFAKCGSFDSAEIVAGFHFTQTYAQQYMVACLVLWVVLLLVSLGFYFQQRQYMIHYDKTTLTAEDYTLRLNNVPPTMTSEKELKHVLEHKLNMHGCIHGVSIAYDIRAVPGGDERVQDMIENLVEYDDVMNGWCPEALARDRAELEEAVAKDGADMEKWLKSGTLRCGGNAFVVFKKQIYLQKVLDTRCGIAWTEGEDYRKDPNHDEEVDLVIKVRATEVEPTGLRWYEFVIDKPRMTRNLLLWMPLRMITVIGIYAAVSQWFHRTMIQPYQDAYIRTEGDTAIALIGQLVTIINVAIQTIVMMDVEKAGFTRTATVDKVTFIWNTVLIQLTMVYTIWQEAYREGVAWVLQPPEGDLIITWFRSTLVEQSIGTNLVTVMKSEIQMMYVLGEVSNVLIPVLANWVVLRMVFSWRIGPDWFRNGLRSGLPRSENVNKVTAREAEKAQILVPLMLAMEYTYMIIFPAMAFVMFYVVTDHASTIFRWLLVFAVVFHIWQRYFMLWGYGKATYDSNLSFVAFIHAWGLVLSMLPAASIWWSWRIKWISNDIALLLLLTVYLLTFLIYECGVSGIDGFLLYTNLEEAGMDDFQEAWGTKTDPGYEAVMDYCGYTWWNVNPIYVLKNRYCRKLPGHQCHTEVRCWPTHHDFEGYFELGKEFRHISKSQWMKEQGLA